MKRGRAWRRARTRVKARTAHNKRRQDGPREKNWKLMYTRADKLARAKQLGFDYPRRPLTDADQEESSS
ncbi:MAG: hypothetical protein GY720_22890 [bacterium]|nr:hypothetical protein [bacterium]